MLSKLFVLKNFHNHVYTEIFEYFLSYLFCSFSYPPTENCFNSWAIDIIIIS